LDAKAALQGVIIASDFASNNRVYRRIDLVDARVDRLKSLRGRESSIRITPRQSRCVEFAERGWRGGGSVLAVAMGTSR
jgi:hypothetical protein